MTTFKFYFYWFKLGHGYWKSRHIWTLMTYLRTLETVTPARSVGDEMAAWLAEQEDDA
jgi:hypothetical protein